MDTLKDFRIVEHPYGCKAWKELLKQQFETNTARNHQTRNANLFPVHSILKIVWTGRVNKWICLLFSIKIGNTLEKKWLCAVPKSMHFKFFLMLMGDEAFKTKTNDTNHVSLHHREQAVCCLTYCNSQFRWCWMCVLNRLGYGKKTSVSLVSQHQLHWCEEFMQAPTLAWLMAAATLTAAMVVVSLLSLSSWSCPKFL